MVKNRRNCPDEYYDQCNNALIKCTLCCAGFGKPSYPLHWKSNSDMSHPYTKDIYKVKRLRQARQAEKTSRDIISKGTLGSGNKNGDGDNLILGELREEVKLRGFKGPLGITRAEWEKGKRQGIDIFSIHFEDENNRSQRLYCLTESLYLELMSIYKEKQFEN